MVNSSTTKGSMDLKKRSIPRRRFGVRQPSAALEPIPHLKAAEGRRTYSPRPFGFCRQRLLTRLALLLLGLLGSRAIAADWPTYRFDNRRSGSTPESLQFPLSACWTYTAPSPPQAAWSGPAKWDSFANIRGLESMRNFDPAMFVIAVGDVVYFGSSLDDAVHCLDARTGDERWVFHTDGPVRLPPSWHRGKVYFGSDDGHAYCLDAAEGKQLWKNKPSGEENLLLNNGKLISHWPCRTGVLVQEDIAYFGASLLPWEPSYLCAVDAQTGAFTGPGRYRLTLEHFTLEGAMLATDTRLYQPQGRQRPEVFDRATGRAVGGVGGSGQGGVFALVTRSGEFVHGQGQNHGSGGELRGYDLNTRDYFVTFPKATRIVVSDEVAYLNTGTELSGFARARYVELAKEQAKLKAQRKSIEEQLKKLREQRNGAAGEKLREELKPIDAALDPLPEKLAACFLWKTATNYPHDLILAGNALFAGGENRVAAFDIATGKELWSAPVSGKAHGLAVGHGHLFVSTERGSIHCFRAASRG